MQNTHTSFLKVTVLIICVALIATFGVNYYQDKEDTSSIIIETQEITSPNTLATTPVVAYITSINSNSIVLDYVETLSGSDAVRAAIADGKCTQQQADNNNCLPNGVYDRNQNSQLRTFELAPNVVIKTASNFDASPDGVTLISVQELQQRYVNAVTPEGTRLQSPLYKITFDSQGRVSYIEEMSRP